MRSASILVLAVLLLSFVGSITIQPASAVSVDVIYNGGFEIEGSPYSWTADGWSSEHTRITEVSPHSGTYHAKAYASIYEHSGYVSGATTSAINIGSSEGYLQSNNILLADVESISVWLRGDGDGFSTGIISVGIDSTYEEDIITSSILTTNWAEYTLTDLTDLKSWYPDGYLTSLSLSASYDGDRPAFPYLLNAYIDDVSIMMTSGPDPTLVPIPSGEGVVNLFFRGDSKTFADETAYHMAQLPRGSVSIATKEVPEGASTFTLSYTVSLLHQYGEPTLLGEELAEITEDVGYEGSLVSQWLCPYTFMEISTTALQCDVLISFDSGAYSVLASFISDRLNYKALSEQTWTFKAVITEGSVVLNFGDAGHQSGIFGILVVSPNQYETALGLMTGGDFFGGMVYPFTYVLHEVFWILLLLIFLLPMYIRYRHISIILIFFVVFAGTGSVLNFLIPAPFIYGAWLVVLFGMTGLLWRAVR